MALSPEEEKLLQTFTDPDAVEKDQYSWDDEFQRQILGMLLCDRYFLVQSQGLIQYTYFADEVHKLICSILFRHFKQYKNPPTKIALRQEIIDQIGDKKKEVQLHYLSELNTVYEYYVPGIDSRDYLRDKITKFAKIRAIKNAFHSSLEVLKKAPESDESWVKVSSLVREALIIDRNFEIGCEYFQTYEERYAKMMEAAAAKDVFSLGFPTIDKNLLGGGLGRGEIGSFMGLSGTGKSLILVAATIANLNNGKKVLYVTTEMNEAKVAERFDAQLADPKGIHGVRIDNLIDKQKVVFDALADYTKECLDPRLLVIKQFAAGTLDVPTFRAYYSQLQQYGFRPDLVILDYIGEMKDYPGVKTYESRYMIVRDLRGFAVEENVCVLTAMQPDRRARETVKMGGVIDDENLADSYGQVRPLDALWSINQTPDEKDADIGKVFAIKHRHGKSRFTMYVEYNKDTLKISELSSEVYHKRLHDYQQTKKVHKTDEVEDHYKVSGKMKAAAKGFANEPTELET